MCKWGDTVLMDVKISARKSYTGHERMDARGIDRCIAPIIKALNDAGIETEESCCGHNDGLGYIALMDGRCFMIAPDKKTWDKMRDFVWK